MGEWMDLAVKQADALFLTAREKAGKEGLRMDQTVMADLGLRWCVLPSEASYALEQDKNLAAEIKSSDSNADDVVCLYPQKYTGEIAQDALEIQDTKKRKREVGAGSSLSN